MVQGGGTRRPPRWRGLAWPHTAGTHLEQGAIPQMENPCKGGGGREEAREAESGDVTTISQQARSALLLVSSAPQKRLGKMEGLDQHQSFHTRFPSVHPSRGGGSAVRGRVDGVDGSQREQHMPRQTSSSQPPPPAPPSPRLP